MIEIKWPCEWCINPEADDTGNPEFLCEDHEAEYNGITVEQVRAERVIRNLEYIDATT